MSTRDVQAVIAASGSVRHGTTMLGGSFRGCTCPKTRCGGVAEGTERDGCPEHRRSPAQLWHWAAECPQRLADAQAAVRRGLAVFPLPAGGRVPEPGWQRRATRDEAALPELLADGRNIGVSCRASGVVALDLDVHDDDGQAVLAELAARLGEPWPETLTVATPSGGRHLYFAAPDGCTIGSVSGGRSPLGSGIDVRGPGRRSGGYLVGPGSVVGGLAYTVVRDAPVASLPSWIGQRLQAHARRCP